MSFFLFRPFTFTSEQVRVVVFRECDWRGTKLLFDSEAFMKVVPNGQSASKKIASNKRNQDMNTGQSQENQPSAPIYELPDGSIYKVSIQD